MEAARLGLVDHQEMIVDYNGGWVEDMSLQRTFYFAVADVGIFARNVKLVEVKPISSE